MKKLFFLWVAATFINSLSFATIRRVGYKGPTISGVDYSDMQLAHDASSVGDTLMFYPGSYNMGLATKRLVYLGFGYFLSGAGSNPNLQSITGDLTLDLYLTADASGSVFEGIHSLSVRSYFGNNVNDVIIKRCNANLGVFNSEGTTCNNWKISQCSDISFSGAWEGGKATNFRVDNSVISSLNLGGNTEHTGLFNNCHFLGGLAVNLRNNGIMFQNCIFQNSSFSNFSNAIFQYSLFNIANPGLTGNNNQFGVAFVSPSITNTIFVGHPLVVEGESADGKYKLKPGSPAIGAGMGGIDLGIFGGVNPYRLSGIPSIPTIYKLEASSLNATTNPFTVTFSTRSNN